MRITSPACRNGWGGGWGQGSFGSGLSHGLAAGQAAELGLGPLRGEPEVAEQGADRVVLAGDHPQQQVLGADVVVVEAPGVVLGLHDDLAGRSGEALEHHRLPIRRPYLRCTVCLVTPSRLAMSCHDQPSSRAFSTWSTSRRSVRDRRAATARNPTSGSLLAAPSAISKVVSIPVSIS